MLLHEETVFLLDGFYNQGLNITHVKEIRRITFLEVSFLIDSSIEFIVYKFFTDRTYKNFKELAKINKKEFTFNDSGLYAFIVNPYKLKSLDGFFKISFKSIKEVLKQVFMLILFIEILKKMNPFLLFTCKIYLFNGVPILIIKK